MYCIRRIQTDRELRAAQRLRARRYLEMGFLDAADLKRGLDVDIDDERSTHLGAFSPPNTLVGTVRMIAPHPNAPLPIVAAFNVAVDEARSVEISRLVLEPDHAGPVPLIGLGRALCDAMQDQGQTVMYAILEGQLLAKLQRLGFPFEAFGAPRTVMNTLNYPTRCRIAEILPTMEQLDRERGFPIAAPYFAAALTDGIVSAELLSSKTPVKSA